MNENKMNKILWLGSQKDEQLLPILRKQGYDLIFSDHIRTSYQADCMVCYAPGAAVEPEALPDGALIIVYEPRSFTCSLSGQDGRFARLAQLAQRADAVVCCDEASRQWWSCLNPRTFLLGRQGRLEPGAGEVMLAQMIAADYLAGCSYARKHRKGLWDKVKEYYREFGLRRTLYRVYEKLSGQDER